MVNRVLLQQPLTGPDEAVDLLHPEQVQPDSAPQGVADADDRKDVEAFDGDGVHRVKQHGIADCNHEAAVVAREDAGEYQKQVGQAQPAHHTSLWGPRDVDNFRLCGELQNDRALSFLPQLLDTHLVTRVLPHLRSRCMLWHVRPSGLRLRSYVRIRSVGGAWQNGTPPRDVGAIIDAGDRGRIDETSRTHSFVRQRLGNDLRLIGVTFTGVMRQRVLRICVALGLNQTIRVESVQLVHVQLLAA
mmetsp:Transcript_7680/g.19027  ORF Transcript_7680/g.19027 Transcript_7680/m.19027 type:complete len:245 (+) Transcript_7680:853-1587(+)